MGRAFIDDSPEKLERNYGNIVVVSEFIGDPADQELLELADYLSELADEGDFRRIERGRGKKADKESSYQPTGW